MNLVDAALGYAQLRWPLPPCIPDEKAPLTRRGFKDATTDPEQIRQWWTRWPTANPAVATGTPGPDVIDIDTKHGRSGLKLYRRAWRAGHLRNPVAVVRTPSGGLHLWYNGTSQRGGAVGRDKALELKAVGGYVLLPPARVTVLGVGGYTGTYQLIEKGNPEAIVDFPAIRELLNPKPVHQPAAERTPRKPGELNPGDDYNQRGNWFDLLTSHGWTYLGHKGHIGYWRRPDKDTGVSATINAKGTNRLKVFTSSAIFEPDESYSLFGAYTVLEHDGRFRAAARALAEAGYGTPRDREKAAA